MRASDRPSRLGIALLLIVGAAHCAPATFTPPAGPGQPAPAASTIWQSAVHHCEGISAVRAELAVSGRAGGRSIPGLAGARVGTAVDRQSHLAIEMYVSGQLAVRMAGSADDATLLLTDGARVVRGSAAEIVDALVGVRLDPSLWQAILTGCPAAASSFTSAVSYGKLLAITTTGPVVYLEEQGGAWSLRSARWPTLSVDYSRMISDRPDKFAIATSDTRLALTVRDVAINPALPATVFTVNVPDDAQTMSLDQLRQEGPLGH